MKQPKISFFLPTLAMGGAERHTISLFKYFRRTGYNASIIVFGKKIDPDLLKEIEQEEVYLVGGKGMSSMTAWAKTLQVFKKNDANLVFTINTMPNIVTIVAHALCFKFFPIVNIFHTTILGNKDKKNFLLYRLSLLLTSRLVFVSSNQKAYWQGKSLLCRKTEVITNGVDLDFFTRDDALGERKRAELSIEPSDIVITILATFRPEKNHMQMVRIFSQLKKTRKNLKLMFVGDGEMRVAAEDIVRQLGLEGDVIFCGSQSDVLPYICATDVGVLCSRAVETFSLASLEMLSCGVPMVMSNIGGASEIVRHGENGFLFENEDDDDFLEKMMTVTHPQTLIELKQRARKSAENHAMRIMYDRYEQIVQQTFRTLVSK